MVAQVRVVVCGGRAFYDTDFIYGTLDVLHAKYKFTAFMQGGHPEGVDHIAKQWARTIPGLKRYECKAEWTKYRKAAGPIRNAKMMTWRPDFVIGFPGGKGTADMLGKAREAGFAQVCSGRVIVLRRADQNEDAAQQGASGHPQAE